MYMQCFPLQVPGVPVALTGNQNGSSVIGTSTLRKAMPAATAATPITDTMLQPAVARKDDALEVHLDTSSVLGPSSYTADPVIIRLARDMEQPAIPQQSEPFITYGKQAMRSALSHGRNAPTTRI